MHRGFGGFRGGFRGGGFGMRRFGFPLLGMGFGMGPLITGLMVGGLGYLLGSNANPAQNPQASQGMPSSPVSSDTLVQLKLLGELHDKGVLTDEEFTREKNRLLGH